MMMEANTQWKCRDIGFVNLQGTKCSVIIAIVGVDNLVVAFPYESDLVTKLNQPMLCSLPAVRGEEDVRVAITAIDAARVGRSRPLNWHSTVRFADVDHMPSPLAE